MTTEDIWLDYSINATPELNRSHSYIHSTGEKINKKPSRSEGSKDGYVFQLTKVPQLGKQ